MNHALIVAKHLRDHINPAYAILTATLLFCVGVICFLPWLWCVTLDEVRRKTK